MLEYKSLETSPRSPEELLEILDHNALIANQMREKIRRLKEIEAVNIEKNPSPIPDAFPQETTILRKDTTFEEEVDYYRKRLESSTTTLNNIFPKRDNPNYKRILLRLKLETKKSMQEINDILAEEMDSSSKSLLTYCKEELERETAKLNLINQELEQDKMVEIPDSKEENRLIFVPTATGKILALEEVKKLSDYREDIYKLFQTIKKGTFRNFKRFGGYNNKTAGISEVRDIDGQLRIAMDQIGPNAYAIISVFQKKEEKSSNYFEQLERKIANYRNMRPILVSNLEEEEFKRENEEYEQMLWNILGKDKKEEEGKKKCKKLLPPNSETNN